MVSFFISCSCLGYVILLENSICCLGNFMCSVSATLGNFRLVSVTDMCTVVVWKFDVYVLVTCFYSVVVVLHQLGQRTGGRDMLRVAK